MPKRIFPLLIFLLLIVHPVAAHGYVIRSIPPDRVVLERPPTRLQYWFSEGLEAEFSAIHLRNQQGEVVASGGVDDKDSSLLTLRVPANLPDGAYVVELRPAFASDGHVVIANRVFFVGAEVGGIAGQAADNTARPLEVVWKTLLFNATALMFGTAVVFTSVLVPVWGSTRYPQGLLPPRVMRRLNRLFWLGWIVALAANGLALIQQTSIFFNIPWSQVFSGDFIGIVRSGSRFGDVWNFRMMALALVGLLHGTGIHYGRKFPKDVRSFWTANVWALALLIGAQAVNSHAAGSLVMPWVAITVHWLHTIGVAFWIGGVLALALVLPVALAGYEGEARWQALYPVMHRFSRYIVAAVLVVITSGLYSASNWFYTPATMATTYGVALVYKLVMVALLLFVGALHHIALRPHLLDKIPLRGLVDWAGRFGLSLRVESLIAIVTLILAALLSATPIPELDIFSRNIEAPSASQTAGEYSVQMTIAPGGPGLNTTDTHIERDDAPVSDATVEIQFVAPERDRRSPWHTAEPADNGLFVVATGTMDRSGRWWALVDIADRNGSMTRAAFEWHISDEAALIQSLPPTPFGVLALISVIAAVAYTLYPAARRLAQQMQWTAVNIVVSGGVILITILALGLSIVALERQRDALELEQNPLPQRVNSVLPDMASLQQGAALYQTYCSDWPQASEYENLLKRLDVIRDDALYAITQDGWRDVPPCTGNLSETERWQLVNYLRTLRLF